MRNFEAEVTVAVTLLGSPGLVDTQQKAGVPLISPPARGRLQLSLVRSFPPIVAYLCSNYILYLNLLPR